MSTYHLEDLANSLPQADYDMVGMSLKTSVFELGHRTSKGTPGVRSESSLHAAFDGLVRLYDTRRLPLRGLEIARSGLQLLKAD